MDRLGVQTCRFALFDGDPRLPRGEETLAALEWTINDVPLTELVGHETSIPRLHAAADPIEREDLLHRLRGDRGGPPTAARTFHRTWLNRALGRRGTPWAPFGPAFDDGRVVLLECPCGDLDCGALTTEVVIGDDVVEWRAIGWQVTYSPFEGFNDVVRSATFDRSDYIHLIDDLLAKDWTLRE